MTTNVSEDISVFQCQFGAERRPGDLNQGFSIGIDRDFQFVQNGQGFFLRQFESFGNNTRMETLNKSVNVFHLRCRVAYLGDVEIRLFEQFTNDQNDRGGPVTGDVILSCCSTSNQRSGRVLHLLESRKQQLYLIL